MPKNFKYVEHDSNIMFKDGSYATSLRGDTWVVYTIGAHASLYGSDSTFADGGQRDWHIENGVIMGISL